MNQTADESAAEGAGDQDGAVGLGDDGVGQSSRRLNVASASFPDPQSPTPDPCMQV